MKRLLKLDQLVIVNNYRGKDSFVGYGQISLMVNNITDEDCDEAWITTCEGENNTTHISIYIKPIATIYDGLYSLTHMDQLQEPKSPITPINYPILKIDPHCINIIDFKLIEKRYQELNEILEKNLNFFKKYALTRDEKLEILTS